MNVHSTKQSKNISVKRSIKRMLQKMINERQDAIRLFETIVKYLKGEDK